MKTTITRVCLTGTLLTGFFAVGCQQGPTKDEQIAALTTENQQLRSDLDSLDTALADCDARYTAVLGERNALSDEVASLQSQLASQPTSPAGGSDANIRGDFGDVEVFRRPGEIVVEVAGDVLFASGKVTLKDDSKRALDQIAQNILRNYPNAQIRIAGHTDSDPIRKSGWKTNERLGAERALAVEEYLAARGLSKDLMYVASFGPAKARSSKAESRRVEIIILAPDAV